MASPISRFWGIDGAGIPSSDSGAMSLLQAGAPGAPAVGQPPSGIRSCPVVAGNRRRVLTPITFRLLEENGSGEVRLAARHFPGPTSSAGEVTPARGRPLANGRIRAPQWPRVGRFSLSADRFPVPCVFCQFEAGHFSANLPTSSAPFPAS